MYFHLILTDNCNLCCRYCRAKAFADLEESEAERAVQVDEEIPVNLAYDLKILYRFLEKDPSPTILFMGASLFSARISSCGSSVRRRSGGS